MQYENYWPEMPTSVIICKPIVWLYQQNMSYPLRLLHSLFLILNVLKTISNGNQELGLHCRPIEYIEQTTMHV